MPTTRCDFTDLPTEACAHCQGHADPDEQTKKDRTRLFTQGWIPAQFPGTCEHCGERFDPGAAIRMEIPRGWRGECCAEVTR
jgi:hypothetical protein